MSKEDILGSHPDNFLSFQEMAHSQPHNLSTMDQEEIKDYFNYDSPSPTQNNDLMSQLDSETYDPLSTDGNRQLSNELPVLEKKKSSRPHTSQKRKRSEEKTALQKACERGYWTKNFLPLGKNPHFKFIVKKMGVGFIMTNPIVREIKEKSGITMEDYLILYKIEELRDIWVQFFRKRVLYRELMLTRAEKISKIIFEKFLIRYQEAFIDGVFDHIA